MAESYSWDIRENAEELFIIDGMTYEEVAERTGVSVSQLKVWGTESDPGWTARRREYRSAQSSIRRGVVLAKAKLIESVIKTEDAQKAYAFSALVNSGRALEDEARARASERDAVVPDIAAMTEPVDMVAALEQALTRKALLLSTSPGGLTLQAIKELQQGMELLEKLRQMAVVTEEDAGVQGASVGTIEQMRAAILEELKV